MPGGFSKCLRHLKCLENLAFGEQNPHSPYPPLQASLNLGTNMALATVIAEDLLIFNIFSVTALPSVRCISTTVLITEMGN